MHETPSSERSRAARGESSGTGAQDEFTRRPRVRRAAHPYPQQLRSPRRTHVPITEIPADALEPVQRRSARRVCAAVGAGACAIGLALTVALPQLDPAEAATPPIAAAASHQQKLFSETDIPADAIPEDFADIAVVEDESLPASFAFRAEALVSFPIPDNVTLTDGFGYRTAPVAQFHDAQDFAAAAGTPIYAIADGTVLEAGFATDGCGFGLKLEHSVDGQEVTSRYCHMEMDSHSYEKGDEVKMGDPVGRVGNTGMSFGPHLHLAIRIDDEPVDPMPFLNKYSRATRGAEDEIEKTANG